MVSLTAVGVVAAASPVGASTPMPTFIPGNVTSCRAGTTSLLVVDNPSSATKGAVTGTVSGSSKQLLAVTATDALDGTTLEVFIKGGPNTYDYQVPVGSTGASVSGLTAPRNGGGNIPTISHYLICQSRTSSPSTPPNGFVGYADSFHVDSTPNPWLGSAGVTFVGCNFNAVDACATDPATGDDLYDGGALRFDNPSSTPMTITDVSVTIGTCVFDPWPGLSETIAPGVSLVLTQTGGPATGPCASGLIGTANAPFYNFDTSEFAGELNAPPYNPPGVSCFVSDHLVPEITLTYNNTGIPGTETLSDNGEVLNTGGFDLGVCTNDGDEFQPWSGPLGP